jgi:hypothetical protein
MTQPYGQGPQQPPQGQPYNPQSNQPSYNPEQQNPPNQNPPTQNVQQGRPGYGQQNYPPQQGYSGGAPVATTATTKGRPNVAGLILAAIAAVLGILSLFVLGWYRDNFGSVSGGASSSSQSKFSKLHDMLSGLQSQVDAHPTVGKYLHFGISPTYFGWLGYLLIAAAVVLAIISCLPTGGAVMLFKILTAIVSLAGIGLTLWAIDLIRVDKQFVAQFGSGGNAPSYGDYLKHTSFGAWAMLLAFLLCLIAALIPPKRVAVVQNAGQGRY